MYISKIKECLPVDVQEIRNGMLTNVNVNAQQLRNAQLECNGTVKLAHVLVLLHRNVLLAKPGIQIHANVSALLLLHARVH